MAFAATQEQRDHDCGMALVRDGAAPCAAMHRKPRICPRRRSGPDAAHGPVLAARPGGQAVAALAAFGSDGVSAGRLARGDGQAIRVWPVRRGREVLDKVRFN
jgi:hypothetical protein